MSVAYAASWNTHGKVYFDVLFCSVNRELTLIGTANSDDTKSVVIK
jgi:hypothetical protein